MRVMILAAGRGERLRPLTDTVPKPLLKVQGTPLIVKHIESLAKAGFKNIVINHAWLGEQIEFTLGTGSNWGVSIEYCPEPMGGYETAGGIIQALPKLTKDEDTFLVLNADIWTDYSFQQLKHIELTPPDYLAHLVLVPKPAYKATADFGMKNNRVLPQGEFVFSGISVLHKQLFGTLDCQPLKLAPILRQAMLKKVTGEIYSGTWQDVGTIERLEELNN